MRLSGQLPELSIFPRPEDFEASISERDRLWGTKISTLRSDLWESGRCAKLAGEVETLGRALVQAVEPLSGKDKWNRRGLRRQVRRCAPAAWDQLISFVRLVHREAAKHQRIIVSTAPRLLENSAGSKSRNALPAILAGAILGGGRQLARSRCSRTVLGPVPGTNKSEQRAPTPSRAFSGPAPTLSAQRPSRGSRCAVGSPSGDAGHPHTSEWETRSRKR